MTDHEQTALSRAPEGGLLLTAAGLASKWGHNDGDEPDEVWDKFPDIDWHPVLTRLVREFLLPLLPSDVEVYEVECIHNPIRTDYWGDAYSDVDAPDIGVTVPWPVVFEYCQQEADR